MAKGPIGKVVQLLRDATLRSGGGGLTDGELLDCFIAGQEATAFEALVHRHGPMVLGVCQRILGNLHDAEDAFQVTFVVLLRKATSVRRRETVGNWLYGVAYHTALKAKAAAFKRRAKEQRAMTLSFDKTDEAWLDLLPLLDQELAHLPEKFRTAVVLCDLEGKTQKEAARQLGWPQGTLSGRLFRARAMLAKRLSRHGTPVSIGVIGALLVNAGTASASLPAPLVSLTVKSVAAAATGAGVAGAMSSNVAALTDQVMKALLAAKLKAAAAAFSLAIGVVLGGVHFLAPHEGEQEARPHAKDVQAAVVERLPLVHAPPKVALQIVEPAKKRDFQGEQLGQHENDPARRGQAGAQDNELAGAQAGFRGEQTGQHEDGQGQQGKQAP